MIGWKGYYACTGGLFANREVFFFPQDDISVNEPDEEFCLIKPQHFFTRLSNLYASFYKSFLLLQTTCVALNIPGEMSWQHLVVVGWFRVVSPAA